MKTRVLIVFGGRSSEHEVSMVSASTVEKAMDPSKYEVHKVYISKTGLWRYATCPIHEIDEEELTKNGRAAGVMPGSAEPSLYVETEKKGTFEIYPLDVAVIAMHGLFGEDGTIQGLFEMAGLPYVGSGVLGSSASMDKITTKRVVEDLGIRQAVFVPVKKEELLDFDAVRARVEKRLAYPVYVKPSNAGSSVGVTKAHNAGELKAGLEEAARWDDRLLVEENINGREIECAVLGHNEAPKASGVGEILAAGDFYTYEAKYHNPESKTVVDPDLPESTVEEIRRTAIAVFGAVGAEGLSRVDFFVDRVTGEVIFNEINTLPGFTSISMYPMLWEARGLHKPELVDELIRLALEKSKR